MFLVIINVNLTFVSAFENCQGVGFLPAAVWQKGGGGDGWQHLHFVYVFLLPVTLNLNVITRSVL